MCRFPISTIAISAALVLGLAGVAGAQEQGRELRWRVADASEALEETAQVRIVIADELRADQAYEKLGIVQTAAYLFSAGAPGESHPLEISADQEDLAVSSVDTDLLAPGAPPPPLEITLEPPGVSPGDVAVGLIMGRPLRLASVSGEERASLEASGWVAVAAARVDPAELDERRRWAADTLVPPGKMRTVWEGAVPLGTNRLYADYLVVRPARIELSEGSAGEAYVRDTMRTPEGGILDMPARATAVGATTSVSLGPALARPEGARVHSIELQRGVLNEIRLRASLDPAGGYRLEVEIHRGPVGGEGDASP